MKYLIYYTIILLSIIILSSCELFNFIDQDSEEYNISGDICSFETIEGFDLDEGVC